MIHSSIVVILSAGGSILDLEALADMPQARVVQANLASGEKAACVAATLEHDCSQADLREALKVWAAGRGWSVTVAPKA